MKKRFFSTFATHTFQLVTKLAAFAIVKDWHRTNFSLWFESLFSLSRVRFQALTFAWSKKGLEKSSFTGERERENIKTRWSRTRNTPLRERIAWIIIVWSTIRWQSERRNRPSFFPSSFWTKSASGEKRRKFHSVFTCDEGKKRQSVTLDKGEKRNLKAKLRTAQ